MSALLIYLAGFCTGIIFTCVIAIIASKAEDDI